MKNIFSLLLTAILCSACQTPSPPANPESNTRTKAVLNYFQGLESRNEKRLVSGQFSNFGGGASLRLLNEIHDRSGHWPAILGVDYADFPTGGLTFSTPNKAAITYWKDGGLVSVSAHLYDPARTNSSGGLRDKDIDLTSLLATNSETHVRWMHELDELAGGLQELKDAGVVVMWRPFHEMNGDWFWWCGQDPETFVKLWRHMFDYFTKTKGLNNLLWVYAPNHGPKTADYYPGDRYVALIGLDAYTDFFHVTERQMKPGAEYGCRRDAESSLDCQSGGPSQRSCRDPLTQALRRESIGIEIAGVFGSSFTQVRHRAKLGARG